MGAGVYSCAKLYRRRRLYSNFETKQPAPGPTPLPILGNVLQLRTHYYETLYRYVDHPISIFWVMNDPFIVVNEENALRRVLGGANGLYTKPRYFGYRSKAVSSAVQFEKNLVAKESIQYEPNGDVSRAALEALVVSSFGTIKTSMVDLLHQLEDASYDGSGILPHVDGDTVRPVRRSIVGLNLNLLFGVTGDRCNEIDDNHVSETISSAGNEFARRMVNPFKVLIDLPSNLKFMWDVGSLISLGRRLCGILDDTVKCSMDCPAGERSKMNASGASWVHAWIGKVGTIGKLGKVVGLLMASTQTVPLAAVWMLHLVANDEKVKAMLRKELKELDVHTIRDLGYEHLDKMKVADAVVKETLRLYPPFPLIQRQARLDNVLADINVSSGSIVYVVPWLVHRNPKYWANAHEFKPERFLEGSSSHGDAPSDWLYLPFGRGSRMCAGSRLALTELKILLCHTICSYEWESRREIILRDSRFPELGMNPRGIKMSFRRRS
ncbi:cytochrome P450 family protein [Gracilaria domingensis]|nr:cytochrome P450 family protein [Gracilaria domingensis]